MSIFTRHDVSRRAFLERATLLGIAGAAMPFVMNLAAIGEAAAATAPDYKALVCLFMYGGNDDANTLVPYDQPRYDLYAKLRQSVALGRDSLAPTVLMPSATLVGGGQYALHPALAPLLPIWNSGHLAAVLNVGTLVQPTTKAQYVARSAAVPPKLFSHNDQASYWLAAAPEGGSVGLGWADRRPAAERQWQCDADLHQPGRQYRLSRGQDCGAICADHRRPGAAQ